jgi:carbon-monoxide dehydrogenase iron sulfur subunit
MYEHLNLIFVFTITNILLIWLRYNMQKVLVIEAEKCVGCRMCETWCAFTHEGEVTPARSRIHVIKWDEKGLDIPMTCQQCEVPVCAKVCPVHAITKDIHSGLVSVDEVRCIGCGLCVVACPFGGCSMDPITHKMFKCDQCGGEPQCVAKCPREVITFEPASKIAMKKKRASATKMTELIEKISSPSHA